MLKCILSFVLFCLSTTVALSAEQNEVEVEIDQMLLGLFTDKESLGDGFYERSLASHAYQGSGLTFESIIEAGVDINTANSKGITALHIAVLSQTKIENLI